VEALGPTSPWHKVWSERFEDGWAKTIWCQNLDAQSNYREIYETCALMSKAIRDFREMKYGENSSYWRYEEPKESNQKRVARIGVALLRQIYRGLHSIVQRVLAWIN
jgi:hypothetical protein